MIPVEINGQSKQIPDGLTIRKMLEHLDIDTQRVAVELNLEIVRKPDWDSTVVEAGAKLEIVMFVGGGLR